MKCLLCIGAYWAFRSSKHIERKTQYKTTKTLTEKLLMLLLPFILFFFKICCCCCCCFIMKYAIHSHTCPIKALLPIDITTTWCFWHLFQKKTWEMHVVDWLYIHTYITLLFSSLLRFVSQPFLFFNSLHPTHVRKVKKNKEKKTLPIREQWKQKKNRSVFSSTSSLNQCFLNTTLNICRRRAMHCAYAVQFHSKILNVSSNKN